MKNVGFPLYKPMKNVGFPLYKPMKNPSFPRCLPCRVEQREAPRIFRILILRDPRQGAAWLFNIYSYGTEPHLCMYTGNSYQDNENKQGQRIYDIHILKTHIPYLHICIYIYIHIHDAYVDKYIYIYIYV